MKGKHHDKQSGKSKPESDQPTAGAASQSIAAATESTEVGAVSAHQSTDGRFFESTRWTMQFQGAVDAACKLADTLNKVIRG